jgi:phosphate transport system permease protein
MSEEIEIEDKNTKNDTQLMHSFDELPKRMRIMNPQQSQKVAFGLLLSSAVFILLVLMLFLGYILVNGFKNFSFKLLFSNYNPYTGVYGFFPAILGTFLLIIGALVIALPLGLLAAIYLTEYTKGSIIVDIIDQGINNLAGVPSIVIGLFGYSFFCLFLGIGQSIIAGWLTLACMLLPTIIRTSQEAIRSVPNSYREGSVALGVTKWRTIRHVVLPSALPGISTGVILAIGRAAGETAAILFVGSGIFFRKFFNGFTGTFMALPTTLLSTYEQSGGFKLVGGVLWEIALVLMLLVFAFNGIAIYIRNRAEKKRLGN